MQDIFSIIWTALCKLEYHGEIFSLSSLWLLENSKIIRLLRESFFYATELFKGTKTLGLSKSSILMPAPISVLKVR